MLKSTVLFSLILCLASKSNLAQTGLLKIDTLLIGTWNGTSICQIKNSPCHDETVVYHISKKSGIDTFYINASKIVNDMEEAQNLAKYITGEKPAAQFYKDFEGQHSPGFDAAHDLERIGVVNQTTMLASDTQAIADFLKQTILSHYGLTDAHAEERFADTRDTLCYATYENQAAVAGMLKSNANLSIVVGGYNSSNTSHLVELCEEKLPTYFISSEEKILSAKEILHYDFHKKREMVTAHYLSFNEPVKILITSGASCPDALVEGVIKKLLSFYPDSIILERMIEQFQSSGL
jgi:4-hydroxy-3-methylbut-2-enyl diphosphate reductase